VTTRQSICQKIFFLRSIATWIEWLGPLNAQEPARAAERIAWCAQAAVTLQETTEGEAARDAAHALLAVAFRWSPRRAIALFQWFLKQRVIGHVEAISILLVEALKSPESPTALVCFSLADFLLSYCQELCMEDSCGVLFHPEPILEDDTVHNLRQVMRGL
jgi:hypothetical protein